MAQGLRTCSVCGGGYRDWAVHVGTPKHRRAMTAPVSRKSSRANARRARAKTHRHQLTRRHERDMWDEEERWMRDESRRSGRHFYGAWTPWGVSAFLGGHAGHGARRASAAVRHHLKRLRSKR